MALVIAAVGKVRDVALAAAIEEYERRAARYWTLTVRVVGAEAGAGRTPEVALRREGERLLSGVPASATLIACAPDGRLLPSREFATWLAHERDLGTDVFFAIGGAFGLDQTVRQRAAWSLSFGAWTMPHDLARLVLAEQLYRAGTIVRGEPYHK